MVWSAPEIEGSGPWELLSGSVLPGYRMVSERALT